MNKLNLSIHHCIFTKDLEKEKDKKEGLLKRLKNIEDENEELLKAKNKNENIKGFTDFINEPLSLEAKGLIQEIRVMQKDVDYRKLKIVGGNREYDFSDLKSYLEIFITKNIQKMMQKHTKSNLIQCFTI